MKNVLFTHTDLDGVGCEIIYRLARPASPDRIIISSEIKNIDKNVMNLLKEIEPSRITFADICASNDVLLMLKEAGHVVEIYDHHPTNARCKEVIPEAIIIPEKDGKMECGTSLLYNHYLMIYKMYQSHHIKTQGNPMFDSAYDIACMFENSDGMLPLFVDTVRSYDTYEFKQTGNILAKELNVLFSMLGYKRFADKYVEYLTVRHTELIDSTSLEFVRAKMENEMDIINTFTMGDIYKFTLNGLDCGLIFGTKGTNISEFGYNFLSTHSDDLDVIILADLQGGTFQMRAVKEGIDLGKDICVPIGGGGHPKAAGAPIDANMLETIKYNIKLYLQTNIDYKK